MKSSYLCVKPVSEKCQQTNRLNKKNIKNEDLVFAFFNAYIHAAKGQTKNISVFTPIASFDSLAQYSLYLFMFTIHLIIVPIFEL